MQKVAIVAHRSEQEKVVDFLHREGVMEISHMRDVASVEHDSVPYRAAELDHVIARLLEFADKSTSAEIHRDMTEESIIAAAHHPDVAAIIARVHAIEEQDGNLRDALHALERGHLPAASPGSLAAADEGAYFTSPAVREDLSHFGGQGLSDDAPLAEQVRQQRAQAEQQLLQNHAAMKALGGQLPLLIRARQYVHWLDEQHAAKQSMKETRATVTVFGWIASHLFEPVEKKLEALSPATAIVKVAPHPTEQPPIALKNPIWLKPFESVTLLYGLPQAHEFDPTPLLAPFFILFFGLCLTDAGYGLVLAAIMGGYLWKKKLSVQQAPLWWLLFIGGIATFFISIPFGGWFGLSADQAPAFMTVRRDGVLWFHGQLWNLGETPGITFLQNLSLALGIIHLCFGVFLAGLSKWVLGQRAAAFWVDWTTLILFAAAGGYFVVPAAYGQMAMYGIIFAALLVLWGKGHGSPLLMRPLHGFLGVLNLAMGMMSNILSYLRLLALGLVTGALALAVNLVAQQIGAMLPAFIGVPVAIIIYIAGHTVNIALNVLGAFIHSGRLQFVEFFSQFFEGGGRSFTPFKRSVPIA